MSAIEVDPKDLERFAGVMQRAAEQIRSSGRSVASGAGGLRFRGREGDRLRQDCSDIGRATERQSQVLLDHARSLRTFAREIDALRRR